ncbi:MAG: hypothetical protein K9G63_11080 [Melioribacteraceae bacterium]|nr:hypothetical protein [Melioribacteraceae bacterium]
MNFQNYFDEYERRARIYPALILLLPLILEIYIIFPQILRLEGIAGGVVLYVALASFFASIVRKKGKDKQKQLWDELGAKPTTILLRRNDKTISKETKLRYYKKIQELIPDLTLPNEEEEKLNPKQADEKYNSAIDYLLEYTRDTKNYSLVFKENILYGFARNLWGIKIESIILIIVTLIVSIIILLLPQNEINDSLSIIIISMFEILLLFFWIFYVNKQLVIMSGNNYGIALLRILEKE